MLYKDNALDSNNKSNYEINKQIYDTKFLFPFLKTLEAIVWVNSQWISPLPTIALIQMHKRSDIQENDEHHWDARSHKDQDDTEGV